MKKIITITTGPMGSGNHLFAKIFDLHPDVHGWDNINDGEYEPHRHEPHSHIWRNADAIDHMDWNGNYHHISISCPFILNGHHVVPDYKSVIDKFLEKGFDVQIGIIGRDYNILELQQTRLRDEVTTGEFIKVLPYLTSLPHTFLSMELLSLYKIDYIRSIGKLMGIPVNLTSVEYNNIFAVNSNKAYVNPIKEGAYDKDIRELQRKGREGRKARLRKSDESL